MGFLDGVRTFYYQIKASSSLGKGEKYFRRKEYEKALNYYKLSLRYEALSTADKLRYAAVEYLIARTLFEMRDYAQALEYAESSYGSMKLIKGKSQVIDKTIVKTEQSDCGTLEPGRKSPC